MSWAAGPLTCQVVVGPGEEGTRSHHESCQLKYLEVKCRAVSVSWAAGPLTCQVMAGQRGGGNQISP